MSTQSTVFLSFVYWEMRPFNAFISSSDHTVWLTLGCLSATHTIRQSTALRFTEDASDTLLSLDLKVIFAVDEKCVPFPLFFSNPTLPRCSASRSFRVVKSYRR